MKRCDNCGWFNLDSAVQCEKCGDESFKSAIEEEMKVEEQLDVVEDFELKEIEENKISENPIQEVSRLRNSMASTVMMSVDVVPHGDDDVHCPKCRYPIVGDVDYCPNCGTTVRINVKEEHINSLNIPETELSVKTQDVREKSFDPKATVRDIPEELITGHGVNESVFKLVPIDAGVSPIVLELDQIVVLEGRRYRFCK